VEIELQEFMNAYENISLHHCFILICFQGEWLEREQQRNLCPGLRLGTSGKKIVQSTKSGSVVRILNQMQTDSTALCIQRVEMEVLGRRIFRKVLYYSSEKKISNLLCN